MSGRRVLVVDDSVASLESMAIFFEIEGFEVQTAQDGAAAVTAVADFKPAVVFMDIQMPHMDGNQAAEKIRASPAGAVPKLVAITGWTRDEDIQRAAEAGFDRVLFKPVSPDDLRGAISELFLDGAGTDSAAGDPPA